MHLSLSSFTPNIVHDIYVKNPLQSTLGTEILRVGNELIAEIGFEAFTFKKLATQIGTTEASVYRYFENKHKLLLYLTSYYWSWVEYHILIRNNNLLDACRQLKNVLEIIGSPIKADDKNLNQEILFYNIINESSKSYLVKSVDELNKVGLYFNYKKIVAIISDIILRINPDFKYVHMLVSTVIEGIHHQIFFANHLPSLTDTDTEENYLPDFYYHLILSTIKND